MSMRVWIDEWQQACCGEEITEGDEVTLHLRGVDVPWFDTAFGAGFSAGLTGCDETHEPTDVERIVEGRVRRISAATCGYQTLPDGSGAIPVRGSGELHRVRVIDGSFRPLRGQDLVGYVVELSDARDPR